jgi:hypothetical protein
MRKCNLLKTTGLVIKEYSDDDEEIENEFIEQMMNDSDSSDDINLGSSVKKLKIINKNEKLYSHCSYECKSNFKEMEKLEEECKNLENKCLLLDYVKSEQINEALEQIEKMNNDINAMIDSVKYFEAEENEKLRFEDLNSLEMKLLKLFVIINNKISKVKFFIITNYYK